MLSTMGESETPDVISKREMHRYGWVRMFFDELQRFKATPVMMRPADVPDADQKLHMVLQTYRRKKTMASGEVKTIAIAFGDWKESVELAEEESRGNLVCLFHAWQVLANIGDPRLAPQRGRLRHFVQTHYKIDINDCLELDAKKLDELTRKTVRREDILPSWLLYAWSPPKNLFVPSKEEFSDDD